ncbi:RNA-directed DNA polymerase [Sphingomonas ginkgonis]|uniref:RNA-directed DNA polymerase n=2 Tax=Sphingomonas ginkgonis TaxID=2315330 RepID=A0A3R9YL48_9SPHN|nr:RNA-directed DNA polymerase [Sphingomonas ginkgonis]
MNYGEWQTRTLGHIRESFGAKVLVKADIANFFGSLYTHSIPWALVGIKTAKSTIKQPLWYNDLDNALQFCKRRETNGIAVGPGTSNIFAEIVLEKVDEDLKGYLFHRYIDDYTAFCTTIEEARRFVRDLERALAKFKLTLNHSKTRFSDLPHSVSPDWVLQIRRKIRVLDEPVRPGAAVDFIDFALLLFEISGDPNGLKYAYRALASKDRHYWTDSVVVEYGLLLVSRFPSIVPALLPFMLNAANRSGRLILQEKLLSILEDSVSRDRTDLACWAMYYIDLIGGSLPDETVRKCVESLDCLAILTAFRFSDTGQRKAILPFARRIIGAPDIHDRHRYWMLTYELYRCGYLKTVADETGIFKVLSNNGVAFMPSLA